MIIQAKMPHEPFNSMVRKGTAGDTIRRILEAARPEAAYFAEFEGRRTAILVVDVADPSKVPAFAEPWFLSFQADVSLHPAMTPDDLAKAGLDALGKKWA